MPAVSEAGLPATYEAARTAIANCEKIDECKGWKDKARAMRAYAIMRDDRTLHNLALRIQLRAERRCGELLKLIEPQPGKRTDIEQPSGGPYTRLQAATAAGMSKDQMVQSLRVAAVPSDYFDAQVESPKPPTISQLAEAGTKKRPRSEDAEAREVAMAIEAIRTFAKFCQTNDPRRLLPARSPRARADLKRDYHAIVHWLDSFADYHNAPVEGSDEADLGEP